MPISLCPKDIDRFYIDRSLWTYLAYVFRWCASYQDTLGHSPITQSQLCHSITVTQPPYILVEFRMVADATDWVDPVSTYIKEDIMNEILEDFQQKCKICTSSNGILSCIA